MEIRKQMYKGSIIVFRSMPPMIEICKLFQDRFLKNNILSTSSHESFGKFENSIDIQNLWKKIILCSGVHGASGLSGMWDRIRLRVQVPCSGYDDITDVANSTGRFSSSLPIHRDTWASNVPQQLNWWAPLVPLSADATLALYPSYFLKSVPNSSADWNFDLLKQNRALNTPYPQLPVLLYNAMPRHSREKLLEDVMPVVIHPGDVLVFSGAQLHGSLATGRCSSTRYSSEVRTVDRIDVEDDVGAVNIDGSAPGRQLQWFSSVVDGSEPQVVISRDYDFESCKYEYIY